MKRFIDIVDAFLVCAGVFGVVVLVGAAFVLGLSQVVTFLEAVWPT